MRALGILLLLFGVVVLAVNWLDIQAEWLGWMREWSEDGALMIGFGGIVLGFVLTLVGRKKKGDAAQ
ncbi:MAG TPA: hypothetical protein VF384_06610 [Planctomycetota bacterium]